MGAMVWDSHIPPRGPVQPCCPDSTRNRPALLGSSPPESQTPSASDLGDRSSGHFSPPKAAKSRASSHSPLLKDTEACETTGLTSTTTPGPRDTPACVRMPRGCLGLWRSPRAYQALPAARPHVRIPCTWHGSRAHAPGKVNALWTTGPPTPSPGPAAGSLLAYPLPDPRPRPLGPPSKARRVRSPLLVGDASRTVPARPAEDTRRRGWLRHGSWGAVLGRALGRQASFNARTPRGHPQMRRRSGARAEGLESSFSSSAPLQRTLHAPRAWRMLIPARSPALGLSVILLSMIFRSSPLFETI